MKYVTAAIIIKEEKILIAKRNNKDKLANKWEFPGGKIEEGETPEECIVREIKEELGVKIVVKAYFGESIYNYESGCIKLLGYYAELMSENIVLNVHEELKWVNRAELKEYDFAPADKPFVKKLIENKGLN